MLILEDSQTNAFNEWLRSYGLYISLAVAGVVFLTVLVLFIISLIKRKKDPTSALPKEIKLSANTSKILEGLGGRENIVAHSLNGSRIVLMLNNYNIVDEKMLNENGVDSLIKMSNKITLVIKRDASKIYKELFL